MTQLSIISIAYILQQLKNSIHTVLFNNMIVIALFLLGLAVGTGILWLIYIIETKKMHLKDKESIASDIPDSEIEEEIIIPACETFEKEYNGEKIGEKLNGLKKAAVSMVQQISKKYYPKSDYPMFEVSPDQLLTLIDTVSEKICRALGKFLSDNFALRNAYKAGIYFHNKNKKDNASYQWRELKIITIKDIIEGIQNKPETKEKKNFFERIGASVMALPNKMINNFINAKMRELIIETGQEINKVYGKKQTTLTSVDLQPCEIKEVN